MEIFEEAQSHIDDLALQIARNGAQSFEPLSEIDKFKEGYGIELSEDDIKKLKLITIIESIDVAIDAKKLGIILFRKDGLYGIMRKYQRTLTHSDLLSPNYESDDKQEALKAINNAEQIIDDGVYGYLILMNTVKGLMRKSLKHKSKADELGSDHKKYQKNIRKSEEFSKKAKELRQEVEQYLHIEFLK